MLLKNIFCLDCATMDDADYTNNLKKLQIIVIVHDYCELQQHRH